MSTSFWTLPTQNVKNLNRHAIVDLIRFTPGGISRVELARHMGLTRAAVTSIVNDLSKAGLVREVESHYPAGRRPIVLEVNPSRGYVIGVDMGATHVTVILADFAAQVIAEVEEPLDISAGAEECLNRVDKIVRSLIFANGLKLSDISAVGIGVPGPIDIDAGMVIEPPIMPGWDQFPIRDYLKKLWGCEISLGNDAELGAVGEWAYGAGRGERNLAYIKMGTGIGAGLLLEGQIYHGATGSAGEIGHITIEDNGPICTCGNRGCLEAIAGGWAIAREAVTAAKTNRRSQLALITPVESITARDVITAARNGDLTSQKIMIDAGAHLGTAIASLVNLFNPSMVVIGGGVAQMGDLLIDPVRKTVAERSLHMVSRSVRITSALLGRRSSAMGAVVQALSLSLHQFAELH
jgi:glucokinase-like ROK family protein